MCACRHGLDGNLDFIIRLYQIQFWTPFKTGRTRVTTALSMIIKRDINKWRLECHQRKRCSGYYMCVLWWRRVWHFDEVWIFKQYLNNKWIGVIKANHKMEKRQINQLIISMVKYPNKHYRRLVEVTTWSTITFIFFLFLHDDL